MMLCDVNVLVYAHREDAPDHALYRRFVDKLLDGTNPLGVSDLVLSGFLRVTTHPRIFTPPTPPAQAFTFADQIRNHHRAVNIEPGPKHWELFMSLCRKINASGNAIPDAYFAALAIESNCEWVTTDRDFARFGSLRWRHPLA
jgi:hypothetical protein